MSERNLYIANDRIAELERKVKTMVTREAYNEALYAAAAAVTDRERLFGLLHHIEEEIVVEEQEHNRGYN